MVSEEIRTNHEKYNYDWNLKLKETLEENKKMERKLYIVCGVSILFIVCEVVGGYYANSISIMTDAAHLASDLVGFAVSIISLKIA
jgi:zinc transporter 2